MQDTVFNKITSPMHGKKSNKNKDGVQKVPSSTNLIYTPSDKNKITNP